MGADSTQTSLDPSSNANREREVQSQKQWLPIVSSDVGIRTQRSNDMQPGTAELLIRVRFDVSKEIHSPHGETFHEPFPIQSPMKRKNMTLSRFSRVKFDTS
jgi:hypothetical protein